MEIFTGPVLHLLKRFINCNGDKRRSRGTAVRFISTGININCKIVLSEQFQILRRLLTVIKTDVSNISACENGAHFHTLYTD